MFFTREDILKIQQALFQLGVKDSELPSAEPVTYNDTLSIVQNGKNKQIKVKDFFNQTSLWKREVFLNITDKYDKYHISLKEAINLVPILQRKDGLVITFQDVESNWEIYQFRGNITEFLDESKWFDLYDYRNYIVQSIIPDEEDLTISTPDENGNSLASLKDRLYDPTKFSGKGYKILRKNIINEKNILTQEMINKINTIYEIRYDFDLNGKEINIPEGCTLKFEGGSLKNGVIISHNTKIINAPLITAECNLKIRGKVYNDAGSEITHYKWDIIKRNCQLFSPICPWQHLIVDDVERAYRCGITNFFLILHIKFENNVFNIVDTNYTSIIDLVNLLKNNNIYAPYLKLHIDDDKDFEASPYNTENYINTYVEYIKQLLDDFHNNDMNFDGVWISNEHTPITVPSTVDSIWHPKLLEIQTYLKSNYNTECWASLQQPIIAYASHNDINISANFYPKISMFEINKSYNEEVINDIASTLDVYTRNTPNNSKHIITECGISGRDGSLKAPETWSLTTERNSKIFQIFYKTIVEGINKHGGIDILCIWYIEVLNTEYQDVIYNELRNIH